MKTPFPILSIIIVLGMLDTAAAGTPPMREKHVWEKVEITLHTEKSHHNPYADVQVWVDLKGPAFGHVRTRKRDRYEWH